MPTPAVDADRDGIGLHLAVGADHDGAMRVGEVYLFVEDVDALYAEWTRRGIDGITRPLGDTAYGLREGSHTDPDGNLIRFGSPVGGPSDADRLHVHLASHHDIQPAQLSELDFGVFRVERNDGGTWVAGLFPSDRPVDAVAGDAEILAFLVDHDFPADRPASPEPVSVLGGRGVLVTDHVRAVPRHQRRTVIHDLGGIRRLGELLGRLHTLPGGPQWCGVPAGPGPTWPTAGPHDEVAAAARLLGNAEGLVPAAERRHYESIHAALESLDDARGLPQALIHPDFVLANVIASTDRGLVVVDWAGSGQGPRLWPLGFLLLAEGARDLRRVDHVVAGYRDHVDLEAEELVRLAGVLRVRPVIFAVWRFCMGRRSLADAARAVADVGELAEAIGERARAAFATKRTT